MDPQTCRGCHEQYYDDWSASMHAHASDDPLFVAMNQRGQDAAQVGTFCVNCHAPMAVRTGQTVDGTNLASLPPSLRGVTCYFCHTVDAVLDAHQDASAPLTSAAALGDASMIDDDSLHLANDGVMRASFHDPVPTAAHASGYSTLHDGTHLESAQLCGGCHDVVNAHGAEIERTYSEWTHTLYDSTIGGNTCGQCHMHKSMGLAATAPSTFVRSVHDHKFPGVDIAIGPAGTPAGVDAGPASAQQSAVRDFLSTELAVALCVRGIPSTTPASISIVVDNVASGHAWPSGAAQDRRAWFRVVASVAGAPIYQSGVVPGGTDPTDLADPDLWLLRDCMLDGQGALVDTFWDAVGSDSNALPGAVTSDPLDPRYYQTHIVQTYPRAQSTTLPAYPDTVTLDVSLLAFPLDLFDDLFSNPAEIGFSSDQVQAMRAQLVPLPVGSTITWTQAAASDTSAGGSVFFDQGIPVFCVSTAGLNPGATTVPAKQHASPACRP
jgi:Cytochrome c554 and c-prime